MREGKGLRVAILGIALAVPMLLFRKPGCPCAASGEEGIELILNDGIVNEAVDNNIVNADSNMRQTEKRCSWIS